MSETGRGAANNHSRAAGPLVGVRIVESGTGDDLVVLLHGFSDNADTWNKVAPALAERARVVALDLPGYGRSVAGTGPLFDGYVRVVVDVLQRHGGPGTVAIVGNSLGAVIALLVATEHPELVDRVVLADMPGLTKIPRLWRLALSRPVECALTPVLRLTPARVARSGFGFSFALAALVRDLSVPSLLVWGRNDLLTPARSARLLQRSLHTELAFIDHCSHCPQLDRPKEFVAVVQPFLGRARRGNALPTTAQGDR